MTATIATVASEFDKFAPQLEQDFIEFVTKSLTKILEKYPTNKDQMELAGSWHADGYAFRSLGYRFLTYKKSLEAKEGQYVSIGGRDAFDAIDTKRIEAAAKTYAADQIAAFVFKLTKKLGMLTDVQVHFARFGTNFECRITGKHGEKQVRVEQNRIINTSKNGLPFHQWPALIYVDGKKLSESAFKKL